MEKSIKGIRETYFYDLIDDYRKQGEKSFLYRSFWAENIRELLKESLPPLSKKNFRKQMEKLSRGFLAFLADEKNEPEQMREHFAQLPEEVKKLLKVHLPQLPESTVKLLKEHFGQLPEEMKELLTGRFPWLLEEETSWLKYGAKIRGLLKETMLERPEWAREVLMRKPPRRAKNGQGTEQEKEKQKKERRDFWKELMQNDAGYEAGLITDAEYYLWLTEYLAVRDIYYKDISIADGHTWLYKLLRMGLGRELEESVKLDEIRKIEKEIRKLEKETQKLEIEMMEKRESLEHEGAEMPEILKKLEKSRARKESRKLEKIRELETLKKPGEPGRPEILQKGGQNIRDKAGVERDLAELAEKVWSEAETGGGEISNRLHDLKIKVRTRKGIRTVDYLPWLTKKLEKMAVHIKIKTWLQDNGYPLGEEDELKNLLQERRKQDFSLRLFGAYCDSEKGYDFIGKGEGGKESDEGWAVRNGFCVWEPDGFEHYRQALLQALEQEGKENFYFPLAMDLHSGCVFFLAGKEYYAKVYEKSEKAELKKKYDKEDAFFCYDFLRLDKKNSDDPEVTFQLQPTFHENAGKSYEDVLSKFKWYCGSGRGIQMESQNIDNGIGYYYEDMDKIPRQKIKACNEEGFIGIPKAFWWAFDSLEDSQPSQMAKNDFKRTQRKIAEDNLRR